MLQNLQNQKLNKHITMGYQTMKSWEFMRNELPNDLYPKYK